MKEFIEKIKNIDGNKFAVAFLSMMLLVFIIGVISIIVSVYGVYGILFTLFFIAGIWVFYSFF